MKYELDTMPVWDAFREAEPGTVCPFCLLEKKITLQSLRYYLSDAVMVPEIRVQMNEKGFSPEYWRLLVQDQRRLPLALAAETRFKYFWEKAGKALKDLRKEAQDLKGKKGLSALASSKGKLKKAAEKAKNELQDILSSCLITEYVQKTMGRYLFTACQLFKTDPDFRDIFPKMTLCAPHLSSLIEMSVETLDGPEAGGLIDAAITATQAGWEKTGKDVYQFTQLFEHNSGGNFSGITDAPERAVSMMSGWMKNRDKNEERRR